MKRQLCTLALCIVMVAASTIAVADQSTTYSGTQASPLLLKILKGVQELSTADTLSLHVWATYSRPDIPSPNLTPLDNIETDIMLKLPTAERVAMLSWLDHGGRTKLYAVGATDNDIGPCVDSIDAANCNTLSSSSNSGVNQPLTGPISSRDLPFTLAPAGNQNGGVTIERGFATVKNDATSETHCLSFKNDSGKKIDGVTFIYKIYAQNGQVLTAGSNLRAGSFEPGDDVPGPATAADMSGIRSDSPEKALLANCWTHTTSMATPALLRAAYIAVGVASVTYDDGTHWALGQ
ncbi:MAG: hypothetical protein JOZ91_05795 [Candidatus Eremiobacteraeota bacterium]|nr:hypothetical protein [Candidatus Eremiobacteraeota bacterium]MBV8204950.1 hypothetical protein [Candidatus Eremiobacteraeota bacterium]MBV8595940.1 hypothetical protein [Candidatus Eremiobacteraeota bacterium]MBV8669380.1 hypothetical protein [Candidatus Eremiobacteraeota bacterium]